MFNKHKKNIKKHIHHFKPYQPNAVGEWTKRDCPGSEVYFSGVVEKCDCGRMRFVAHHPGLNAVECAL